MKGKIKNGKNHLLHMSQFIIFCCNRMLNRVIYKECRFIWLHEFRGLRSPRIWGLCRPWAASLQWQKAGGQAGIHRAGSEGMTLLCNSPLLLIQSQESKDSLEKGMNAHMRALTLRPKHFPLVPTFSYCCIEELRFNAWM